MKNLGSYAVFSGAAVYDHHLNCAASLETLLFTMCISACANFKFAIINKIPVKWVDRGMTDSPEYIKHTLEEYLKHL